ncbi:hypothetical protein C8J56DRAFT_1061267 [Mycena floridula]|nr:hypothetical protein C8J56DRAFT_1061267 [Mycena floridula]
MIVGKWTMYRRMVQEGVDWLLENFAGLGEATKSERSEGCATCLSASGVSTTDMSQTRVKPVGAGYGGGVEGDVWVL